MVKVLLLGSGELGKELVIALKRLGVYVIACDSYENAPAMQVADSFEVFSLLDGDALDIAVEKHRPDIIVPEIESIRTEKLFEYEKKGFQVVPSAKAANFTMNRRLIRDLASKELGVRTAKYHYATDLVGFKNAVEDIGLPCVVKPLMSSSGKGQSLVKRSEDIEAAWKYAIEGSRGDIIEVIIEEFIEFHTEITLLTVTQKNGPTLFCPPIGHRQERGDYMESWQPCNLSTENLKSAQEMADKVTAVLGGAGIWGIEFFITDSEVVFSELSPRPHDTGMVTLSGTQNLSEFELHARAILGYPIPEISLERAGVSVVILATVGNPENPKYTGIEEAIAEKNTDIRIFGKPNTRKYRRMGVSLVYDDINADMDTLRKKASACAAKVKVN
ncbi:formate-dependent phosphoribosylglycinamide formyltransferase [bacterium]|nr:formate-dependent phosphoribosylglycinamide formyltransferase [bacterium]